MKNNFYSKLHFCKKKSVFVKNYMETYFKFGLFMFMCIFNIMD